MINQKRDILYKQLNEAEHMMRDVKNVEERVALANYIGNLYRSLVCMGDKDITFDRNRSFGGRKNYNKFVKKLNVYSDRLLQKYLLKKDFHKSYMGEILPEIEEEMSWYCKLEFPLEEQFREQDFIEVLFEFMKSIGQEKLISKLYNGGHIHSTIIGQDTGNLGFALYNPLTQRTDLFIKDFQYDISSMITLVHELGHGFDLSQFHQDVEEYNRYFYISFYGEVFSRLFERLLHRFLLKNHIKEDTIKDKIIDFEVLNHDYLLQAYIFSLLDSDFLISDQYLNCDSTTLAKKVSSYFMEDADIEDIIERMGHFDLAEVYNYAYGDILSLFFVDEVEKNGFSSEMIKYFLEKRSQIFDEEFLKECGFGPVNYTKLYKKEVEVLRK